MVFLQNPGSNAFSRLKLPRKKKQSATNKRKSSIVIYMLYVQCLSFLIFLVPCNLLNVLSLNCVTRSFSWCKNEILHAIPDNCLNDGVFLLIYTVLS